MSASFGDSHELESPDCQAMVGYTLRVNRSFNILVHNSRIDFEILSNDKDTARGFKTELKQNDSSDGLSDGQAEGLSS